MIVLLQILFWFCIVALVHSYLLYPLILRLMVRGEKENKQVYIAGEELPAVSILIAAYNEQDVIAEKLESIFKGNYPLDKLEVLVGSDASTDGTNSIVKEFATNYPQVKLIEFSGRTGKIGIMNSLCKKARYDLFILTDANVFFDRNTLFELVKHFKNPQIGLVDSNMINRGLKKEGISVQEKTYIQSEVAIKNAEGILWGSMMGPFGGCYAMRKKYFKEVPANFLVDDFYINMKTIEQGGRCINEIDARVYEDVSNNLSEEFRRKIRISTGNFQNLFAFFSLLLRFNGIAFSFLSHKVLRWLGPLFIVFGMVATFVLSFSFQHYRIFFYTGIIIFTIPIIDILLKKINIHNRYLRFVTHLLGMNLALFIGLIKYAKGVNTSIWEPTKRNQ